MQNNLVLCPYAGANGVAIFLKFGLPEDFLFRVRKYQMCLSECAVNLLYGNTAQKSFKINSYLNLKFVFFIRHPNFLIWQETPIKYNSLNKALAVNIK